MTHQLTKLDLAALRQCDYLHVTLIGATQRVRATKRVERTESNPFAQDVDYVIPAPVKSHKSAANPKFSELINIYRDLDSHASSVLAILRAGDEIEFQFYPDAHTNQNMERAGLHGDVLRLIVKRGEKRLAFDLSSSTCPDNSARMCQNAQYSLVA